MARSIAEIDNIISNSFNKRKERDEEKKTNTSNANNSGSKSYIDKAIETSFAKKTINFDTLSTDLTSMASTIGNVYSSWQTPETMRNTKSSIQSMYDRIGKYQEYQQKYGGADLSELQAEYQSVLDNWDDLAYSYSGYKSADAWKKSVAETEGMKTADLGVVQKEITDLEGILAGAKPFDDKLKELKASQSAYETNKNRIPGDMPEGYYSKPITETSGKLDEYLKSVGYGSVEEIEKTLGEKKVYHTNASRLQNLIKLSSVGDVNSENYDKDYNKYVESGKNSISENAFNIASKSKNEDFQYMVYEAGGRLNEFKPETAFDKFITWADEHFTTYNDARAVYDKVTEKELNDFYYYVGKDNEDGGNRAEEYVNLIMDSLNSRRSKDIAETVKNTPWGEAGFSIVAGLDQAKSGIEANFSKEDYIPYSPIQQASGRVRHNISEEYGSFATGAYDFGVTASNMLPSILASTVMNAILPGSGVLSTTGKIGKIAGKIAPRIASSASMFASARGNAYQEMLNLGYDKKQASTYGTLVGASEAGLQALLGGISKLGTSATGKGIEALVSSIDNGFARFAIRYPLSIASEGVEEGLQEILNPMFKNIAAGYDTGAKVDWGEVAYSTLLGALMGGFFEGLSLPGEVSRETRFNNALGQNIKANERVGDILNLANNPEMGEAYETYTEFAKKGINADNISNYKLGRLSSVLERDAQAIYDSKKSTDEQKDSAKNILDTLKVYSQGNAGARTGSAKNFDKKWAKKSYDKESTVSMIADGLESAEGTESHKLAVEYMKKMGLTESEVADIHTKILEGKSLSKEESSKLEGMKNLSVDEITKLSDANDAAIRAEESLTVTEELVERGESKEVAEIVSRKMRGETITTEEATKLNESENAYMYIAEKNNADNVTEELLTMAKSMPKKDAALFVALYDGKTDVEAYANAFNLAVMKSENNFSEDEILRTKNVLSNEQVAKIFEDVRIKADKEKTDRFRKLIEATADKKFYKGFIDESVIDYNNTSAEGKVNWKDLTNRQRKAITFMNGFAKATGINLVWTKDDANANGKYDKSTNTIYLDVNAGIDDMGKLADTIIPTASHELTHWLENKSPELFRKISNLVFTTLYEHDGKTEEKRIKIEIDKMLANEYVKQYEADNPGKTISAQKVFNSLYKYVSEDVRKEAHVDPKRVSVARSEIVARACEEVLSLSEQGKTIFNSLSKSEQKTLGEKIKEIIQDLVDWVSDMLSLYKEDSLRHDEAKIMHKYQDKLSELVKLWDKAIAEGVEVNQAQEKSGEYGHKMSAEGDVLNSIREEYASEIDLWEKEDMPKGETFILGTTGDVLQGLGAIESDIYMLGDKIKEILDKHPEMTIEEIKKIPQILENPVLILKSQNVNRNGKMNTRLVIYGTVKAQDGKPILSVLDLRPMEKNLVVDDMQKVTSAYTKDVNPVDFVKKSLVVYADKKRTTKLLKSIGFKMPIELQQSGYIGSISYFKRSVNIKGEEFSKIFKESSVFYSDRDSVGNTLTKEQIEYFKDSKVRDAEGNLLVVYHGTYEDFTVFDISKTSSANVFGKGHYFTSKETDAQDNYASGDGADVRTKIEALAWTYFEEMGYTEADYESNEAVAEWNDAYDKAEEFYKNGKVMQGYLNIKNPVYAQGSELYDANGDFVSARSAEYLKELGYDGIIDYGVSERFGSFQELDTDTVHYVAFDSEQFKDIANTNPTSNPDILFSMRDNIEETKDLVAVHNMRVSELERTLDLGGLPMPSIAIIKAKSGHSEYGDVSLVFPKSTIDPKADKNNKVYGGDAWTPTYPTIEYKPNEKVSDRISKKYYELSRKFGYDESRPLYKYVYELEDVLNRHKGEAGLLEELYEDEKVMQVYLLDIGKGKVETIKKEVRTELTDAEVEMNEFFIKELGADVVNAIVWDGNGTPMSYRKEYLSKYEDSIREAYKKLLSEEYHFTDEQVQNVMDSTKNSDLIKFMRDAHKYSENGRVTTRTEDDYESTKTAIKSEAGEGYREWIDSLFKGIEEKSGIRNNTDLFTNSGNRRSWEALHWENNLENVVKVMKSQDNGQTFFGGQAIWSVSAKDYSSVSDIKADSDRLKTMDKEQYEAIKEAFGERFNEIAVSMMDNSMDNYFIALDNAMECIIDALRHSKTKSGILNYLKQFKHLTVTETNVNDIVSLVTDISNMPTEYFEAKPKRAVELNEIATAIIPDSTSEATKTRLKDMGIKYLEYESGNENSRLNALNSLEDDVLFSKREDIINSNTERTFSYDELVAKGEIKGVVIKKNQQVKLTADGKVDMAYLMKVIHDKCEKIETKSKEPTYYIEVPDIERNVEIINDGVKHGVRKNLASKGSKFPPTEKLNARVSLELPEILKNSIEVNRSFREGNVNVPYTHVMLGIAAIENDDGTYEYCAVRMMVEERINQNPILTEANILGRLSSANAKKVGSPNARDIEDDVALTHDETYTYNIAELLENVKTVFNNTFSLDVYEKLGMTRYADEFSDNLLYSEREDISIYELMGEKERLQKQNKEFKAELERLRERLSIERKVTNKTYIDNNKALVAAGHIRNIANSTYDKIRLAKEIQGIYSYIGEADSKSEALFRKCYEIADNVLREAKEEKVIDDHFKSILKDIRTTRISLDDMQKQEARYLFGDHYNRSFMGRVIIAEDGIRLDSKWKEWAEKYPDQFDSDVNPNDQIGVLYDIINTLQEASETVVEYDAEERKRWLTYEIFNTFWNLPTVETVADKYDKRIKQIRTEHREAMTKLRNEYKDRLGKQRIVDDIHYGRKISELKKSSEESLAGQKKADRERFKQIYANIRERKDAEIALAKEHGREMLSSYKERAEMRTRIQSITSNALTLNEWIVKNSKDKHINESLKGPVMELISAIDFSSKRLLNKGVPTKKDVSLLNALRHIEDKLGDLGEGDFTFYDIYGSDVADDIKKVIKAVEEIESRIGDKEFVLQEMSLSELKMLDNTIRIMKHAVIEVNKFHTVNHAKGIIDLAGKACEEMDKLGAMKYKGVLGKALTNLDWNNTTPYYAFRRYGDSAFKVFESYMDGYDKIAFGQKEAIDFTNSLYTDKDVRKWEKTIYEFNITQRDGKERNFKMSLPQIMELYCSYKQDDVREHFLSGITLTEVKKGKQAEVVDNILLDDKHYLEIFSKLNEHPDAKKVADSLHEYMGRVGAKLINEISMARWGIKTAGVTNYYPIKVSKGRVDKLGNVKEEKMAIQNELYSLINAGFTKNRKPGANQSVLIGNIFDTFATHMAEVITYNAMALPVLDALKWFNYRGKDGFGKEFGTQTSMFSAFGTGGTNYFTQLIKDINGVKKSMSDGIYSALLRNYKISSVGASLKVALLQPTAYAKAYALIDAKYLIKGAKLSDLATRKGSKKAQKYCGAALQKSMGYVDTHMSRGLANEIKHTKTIMEKLREFSMKGAEFADDYTFGCLWNACELEVRDKRKDLKVGSEEFYKAISDRMREVIYSTQVMDNTLTRSQIMRNPDGKARELTMFMSEPTLGYNMVTDAFISYSLDKKRYGKEEAKSRHKHRIGRVLAGYTLTNALAAVVETAFSALLYGDDEEDENFVWKEFLKNFALNMSLLGKITYFKDVVSIFQGFDTTRVETNAIVNFFEALGAWKKVFIDGKSNQGYKAVSKSIETISQLTGLPFYKLFQQTTNLFFSYEELKEMFADFMD